ncbi:uncharacterized protein KY384_003019 [Bacidia gigantensis]|uniref:uncharacterized protein n=1 Tax=Bacidia gigantensis TaxID=2732470 RepID=UPI001D04EEB6|nr:uncharacterized protein KY384_003019 [Bacidia gigantensis]KAG8531390.1 hypothetical protein KY384_003019 [Bacidia gigantensis]
MAETNSPKPPAQENLAYYKAQYEQLEAELADFQASSKELEAELEKDVEASEKRERQLQQKVEGLGYEVEEWKNKYKQAKSEANSAQNALQKEITNLRDTNRTVQHRLRDIEVSNDDMERQARNTTSSLEDLESKYSVAIERGVMAEEEIRIGEQEREGLRIESQRLRDELSDLRIEAEIRQDKLRRAEDIIERQNKWEPSSATGRPQSALSDLSPATSVSSPTIPTPPTKSASSTVSETLTPPSPPTSEKSNPTNRTKAAIPSTSSRQQAADSNITPKPSHTTSRPPRYSKGPMIPVNSERTPHVPRTKITSRPHTAPRQPGLAQSGSLYHLHGLMNKMQSLEQRVHSARSKLPAPTSTPPRASPRSGSALGQSFIPATVTVRSNKKRSGGSNASWAHTPNERPASRLSSAVTHGTDRPSSRLSSGIPQPSPNKDVETGRPPSRDQYHSRPGSRASLSSRQSFGRLPGGSTSNTSRPSSRQSIDPRTPGALTGPRSTIAQTEPRRPRSSVGESYTNAYSSHGHSASLSRSSFYNSQLQHTDEEDPDEVVTPTPSRRSTFTKPDATSAIPAARSRLSGFGTGRRTSLGTEMGPPERKPPTRKLSEVGESY